MESLKVAILMGSDSDYPVVKNAEKMLIDLGIRCSLHVISAHRTPKIACDFASNAKSAGYGVIIAAAGKAAHLAGVIAAHTILPVIGIPIKSSTLDGLDALLSTVQMPKGIPVATVAIDGAENAAIIAAQILGIHDAAIADKLIAYKKEMEEEVIQKDKLLRDKV